MLPASLIAILNFYLSFVAGFLYRHRNGSLEGFRFVSGIPLLGSLLVLFASILGFGAIGTAISGIAIVALDSGGLPWFLLATWSDSSLWDSDDVPFW